MFNFSGMAPWSSFLFSNCFVLVMATDTLNNTFYVKGQKKPKPEVVNLF